MIWTAETSLRSKVTGIHTLQKIGFQFASVDLLSRQTFSISTKNDDIDKSQLLKRSFILILIRTLRQFSFIT